MSGTKEQFFKEQNGGGASTMSCLEAALPPVGFDPVSRPARTARSKHVFYFFRTVTGHAQPLKHVIFAFGISEFRHAASEVSSALPSMKSTH